MWKRTSLASFSENLVFMIWEYCFSFYLLYENVKFDKKYVWTRISLVGFTWNQNFMHAKAALV